MLKKQSFCFLHLQPVSSNLISKKHTKIFTWNQSISQMQLRWAHPSVPCSPKCRAVSFPSFFSLLDCFSSYSLTSKLLISLNLFFKTHIKCHFHFFWSFLYPPSRCPQFFVYASPSPFFHFDYILFPTLWELLRPYWEPESWVSLATLVPSTTEVALM